MTGDHSECGCDGGTGRREFVAGCGAAVALAATGTTPAAARETGADVANLLEGLEDNWGRWGDEDELGALNVLDGDETLAGMAAASAGESTERFTLQLAMTGEEVLPPDGDEPTLATGDPAFPGRTAARRDNEFDEQSYRDGEQAPLTGMKFADDKFVNELFLQATTHVDALGHGWYGDELYNGFDAITTAETKTFQHPVEDCEGEATVRTRGLGRSAITEAATAGIAGRGVLLDVGRQFGGPNDRLPPGEAVTLQDLRATARAQGLDFEAIERDVLLIRTGSIARTRDPTAPWDPANEPGLKFSEGLYEWIRTNDIPTIGADNLAVEKVYQEVDGQTYVLPLHGALLRDLGVSLMEILWLEDLAAACAEDRTYEFLFTAAPLKIERATGAPVNPVVVKATGE